MPMRTAVRCLEGLAGWCTRVVPRVVGRGIRRGVQGGGTRVYGYWSRPDSVYGYWSSLSQCTSPGLALCTSPSQAWLYVLVLAWPGSAYWSWLAVCVLVLSGPGRVSVWAWLGVVSGSQRYPDRL